MSIHKFIKCHRHWNTNNIPSKQYDSCRQKHEIWQNMIPLIGEEYDGNLCHMTEGYHDELLFEERSRNDIFMIDIKKQRENIAEWGRHCYA